MGRTGARGGLQDDQHQEQVPRVQEETSPQGNRSQDQAPWAAGPSRAAELSAGRVDCERAAPQAGQRGDRDATPLGLNPMAPVWVGADWGSPGTPPTLNLSPRPTCSLARRPRGQHRVTQDGPAQTLSDQTTRLRAVTANAASGPTEMKGGPPWYHSSEAESWGSAPYQVPEAQ